ncbi:hypothetical protein [Polaribacter sp. SA4-12]|jgi:hypothetical protein|uniref:hypothetical protein n=1 Tax=Polaribacter sp. SA4-12 TaxID=1312072 RepID=UPI000B3CF2DA|nr:hypothetical protein [Polaribacter sp. SA4-12]ARV15973.1 hypothetical protein BTO07_12820 [Polaribacter sp. SA4-12]
MKKLQLLITVLIISFSTGAQDLAMNTQASNYDNVNYNEASNKIVPLLEETTYTYKYKGDNVLVVFTENRHIEYFNNKQHSIKSSLLWTSETECEMTILESNLPNFPFRNGTKLNMKINKVKNGYIYYQSTLGGRSWTGKMKKLN